jgi:hypothetical protein
MKAPGLLSAPSTAGLVLAAGLGLSGHALRAGDTPARAEATPEALVGRLSSPSFQEREAAGKALRGLGAKAVPALKAGLTGGSAEGAERCTRLLAAIRKDDLDRFVTAFAADAGDKATFDHPVWAGWAKVVGDDRGSRDLLAEVLVVGGAADALDRLAADPKAAADLYPAELDRLHGVAAERSRTAGQGRWPSSVGYSLGEAAYGVYLGTYAGAASVKPGRGGVFPENPEMDVLETMTRLLYLKRGPWSAEAVVKGEYQAGNRALAGAKNRLLAASLLNLKNPLAVEHGLRRDGGLRDVRGDLTVCLPLARMVCREAAFPVQVRAASWPYLAEAGEADYLPDMAALQTDGTRVQQFWRSDEGSREYTVLVSDVSIAAQLLLHRQALKDFGFIEKLDEVKRGVDKSCFAFGFPDDASRTAVHAKALAFLAKAPPPKPRARPK